MSGASSAKAVDSSRSFHELVSELEGAGVFGSASAPGVAASSRAGASASAPSAAASAQGWTEGGAAAWASGDGASGGWAQDAWASDDWASGDWAPGDWAAVGRITTDLASDQQSPAAADGPSQPADVEVEPAVIRGWAVAPSTHGRSYNLDAGELSLLRQEAEVAHRCGVPWQERAPPGPDQGGR
jgi:hypothetical protein